jgi:predicted ester cyclase
MYAESNQAVSRRFIQKVFNEGELSLVGDFISADAVNHEVEDSLGDSRPRPGRSPEWMADLVYLYRRAFPDLRLEIEGQVSEGDRVVTQLRMRGTHRNTLMTIAATGRTIDVAGLRIDRFAGGKIAESWFHLDSLALLRQLRALPELARNPLAPPPAEESQPFAPWSPSIALSQLSVS